MASRVDHKTISTIDRAEGTDLPYPLHASLSAAMLACERRIEELDALTTAVEAEDERAHLGERACPLRLVRP